MNCTRFRKYAGAFADGELDVQLNLEALEHLNMCPNCARNADNIASLKTALAGVWSDLSVPEGLREKVTASLAAETETSIPVPRSGGSGGDQPGALRSDLPAHRRTRLMMVPLAIAAVLLIAVSVWQRLPAGDSEPGRTTASAARAASDLRRVHLHCAAVGAKHHDESLSRELPVVAERLRERLKLRVIAPDLSARGFELLGADCCKVNSRSSAHILYNRPEEQLVLSLFTLRSIPELQPNDETGGGNPRYFISAAEETTVVVWQDGPQTYAICAQLAVDPLLEMADTARVAWTDHDVSDLSRLAFATR